MSENEDLLCKLDKELKVIMQRIADQREEFKSKMKMLKDSEATLISDVSEIFLIALMLIFTCSPIFDIGERGNVPLYVCHANQPHVL